MSEPSNRQNQRLCQIDQFEDRLVMSGQALTDLPIVPQVTGTAEIQGALSGNAGDPFGLADLRNSYGLDGSGQTVAIIDTGIAWDHYALGNGYGQGHKVVGGWDFAENDANPYDDGPAGYHGTHVSGIVGSNSTENLGVAPGADLVGLRVFDDNGLGDLDWVEQALQWVHDHKDAFANPITTVNLSLGGNWNSQTVPDWGNLENELAQLESDGIFISVAAGNSFQQYLQKGLSYPAVSSHVVAVGSAGTDNQLSDFSQRDNKILVAPGEDIRSTVPDHLFHGTGTNKYLTASGTSMAAPYIAGASVLLREAYDFMGIENVTQNLLYSKLFSTADKVYDQVTGGYYSHLNLERAIASVMQDDFANSWSNPQDLGNVTAGVTVNGSITRINDQDFFSFTANRSGQVTFEFESADNFQPQIQVSGGSYTWAGNKLTLNVVSGAQYKFSVGTADDVGHYRFQSEFTPLAEGQNLGTAFDLNQSNQFVDGQRLYNFSAGRDGILTVQGSTQYGNVGYEIYNSQMQLLSRGTTIEGVSRIDVNAEQGEVFILKLTGTGKADFQVCNMVSKEGNRLIVNGTLDGDSIVIDRSQGTQVSIDGLTYTFSNQQVSQVEVYGHGGNDSLRLILANGDNTVSLGANSIQAWSANGSLVGNGIFTSTVIGNGGNDVLIMQDSSGDDTATHFGMVTTMRGNSYANYALGFERTFLNSAQGHDSVSLQGTGDNERFSFAMGVVNELVGNRQFSARNFSEVSIEGGGGQDIANLLDSSGNDQFSIGQRTASASIGNVSLAIRGVSRINAIANEGYDQITLTDSAGDDRVFGNGMAVAISGIDYNNFAVGFDDVRIVASTGNDLAQLTDTRGNDTVWMSNTISHLALSNGQMYVHNFDRVNIWANGGGHDQAHMLGTVAQDKMVSNSSGSSLVTSTGNLLRAVGFETLNVDGLGGTDIANLVANAGHKTLSITDDQIQLTQGALQTNLTQFEDIQFDGVDQLGEIVFADFSEDDLLQGAANTLDARLNGMKIKATNFDFLEASTRQGNSSNYELDIVDYLFMLDGNWNQR